MMLLLALGALGACGSLTVEIGCDRRWYPDADVDGFGADDGAVTGCEAPEGFVAVGGDCDDADDGRHPLTRWYGDGDGDGFGSGDVEH